MSIYLDASFVVSLYSRDVNSLSAAATISKAKGLLVVSSLCEFEAINAFELQIFRKLVSEGEALRSRLNLESDLLGSILRRTPMPDKAFTRAHSIAAAHTRRFGTRGADVLHISIALELSCRSFFSFDTQQRRLAEAVGLEINSL